MNTQNLLFFFFALVSGCGCANHRMEKAFFFDQPASNRVERLRQYSLEDQYTIFRYGMDVVHPPTTELARPIAERGADAVPFLMLKMETNTDALTIADILVILQGMTYSKTYDIKTNTALMTLLSSRVEGIEDDGCRELCRTLLSYAKGD